MTKKVNEISTGDYYSKAHKAKISAAAKMMFADPAKPETQKAMRDFKNRDAGMKRAAARTHKAMAAKADADRAAALQADKENLPGLMAQYQKLRSQFDPQYDYSDDHSYWSRQREIAGQLRALQDRINKAGGSVKEDAVDDFLKKGGKISYGKTHPPRKGEKWIGSAHIGKAGGKGTKGSVTGRAANTKSGKPVVSVEGTNPEYDDEAGMADNNLETLRRTIDGIDQIIKPGDNLPEWCQEKVAVAKSMLVAVWDYMQSEQERGAMESQTNEWKKSTKAPIRPRNPVAKNASAGIGGGAAGAHKSKKKELPRKEKHKKKPELAESATYDRRLNLILEMKLLKEQFKDLKK